MMNLIAPWLTATLINCPINGIGRVRLETINQAPVRAEVRLENLVTGKNYLLLANEIMNLEAGPYRIIPQQVTSGSKNLVQRLYQVQVLNDSDFCLAKNEQRVIRIKLSPVVTSGRLWLLGANGIIQSVDGEMLAKPGVAIANFTHTLPGAQSLAFDANGSLWIAIREQGKSLIHQFSLLNLKRPVRTITALPEINQITFDRTNRLIATHETGEVVLYQFSQTPRVIANLKRPRQIAVDKQNRIWLTDHQDGIIIALDPTNFKITHRLTVNGLPPVARHLKSFGGMTFDSQGNLWLSAGKGLILQIKQSDLEKDTTVTPSIQIGLGVGSGIEQIDFDAQGNLWFAYGAEFIAKLTPKEMVSTPPGLLVIPQHAIAVRNLGFAKGLMFFPPAFVP